MSLFSVLTTALRWSTRYPGARTIYTTQKIYPSPTSCGISPRARAVCTAARAIARRATHHRRVAALSFHMAAASTPAIIPDVNKTERPAPIEVNLAKLKRKYKRDPSKYVQREAKKPAKRRRLRYARAADDTEDDDEVDNEDEDDGNASFIASESEDTSEESVASSDKYSDDDEDDSALSSSDDDDADDNAHDHYVRATAAKSGDADGPDAEVESLIMSIETKTSKAYKLFDAINADVKELRRVLNLV